MPDDNVELGYILLEQSDDWELPAASTTTIADRWQSVELLAKSNNHWADSSNVCCHCRLQWSVKQDSLALLNFDSITPFHGSTQQSVCCHSCGHRRSDGSLLLGLLVACGEAIQVQSLQLLSHQGVHKPTKTTTTTSSTSSSVCLTLSFPNVIKQRCLVASKKNLSPALQALLLLVESDWTQLKRTMDYLASHKYKTLLKRRRPSQQSIPTFFPATNSISELYQRLPSEPCRDEHHTMVDSDRLTTPILQQFHSDLWIKHIVVFLHIPDVQNLRQVCRYYSRLCASVVPGLRLTLFQHQIRSLAWMKQRESDRTTELDSLESNRHKLLSAGQSTLLQSRDGFVRVRLNGITGHEYSVPCLERPIARGGMLCDDPGLGKTITVLALILQTLHCHTVQERPVVAAAASDGGSHALSADDDIFNVYWTEEVMPAFRLTDYLKLLNRFGKKSNLAMDYKLLKRNISGDVYGSHFSRFEESIQSAIAQALLGNPELVAEYVALWNEIVVDFQRSQMRCARKFFSNVSSKPNSRVAALIERDSHTKLIHSLVPSTATLLVIPAVLMEHWQTQMEQHVDWSYATDLIPLTFSFSAKTTPEAIEAARSKFHKAKTHAPMVFLDKAGTNPLPKAHFLSQFQIVITTTQRFKNEWKNGSFSKEIQRENENNSTQYRYLVDQYAQTDGGSNAACELLKVHWSRMIVDEGHNMGNSKTNSTIQFASWIQARRRWVMTGTPTKHSKTEMNQLNGLLRFLKHGFFTPRLDGDMYWRRNVAKGWSDGSLASFFRLRLLLGFLMKRHTKLDIEELPPPIFEKTSVPMSFAEVTTYNTLVSAVQTNIMLTSMKAKTSGRQDSLLHRNQAKNARQALGNIRRVCTGWSRVVPMLSNAFYVQTMEMAKAFNLTDDTIAGIKRFIHRAETEELSECVICKFRLPFHILMSCCGGLVCTECMTNKTTTCLICDKPFDADELQKFQPGFELKWQYVLEMDNEKRTLGETSAAALAANVDASSNIDDAAQQNNRIVRPPQQRQRTKIPGDGHICEYDCYSIDGKCLLCREEHDACNFMNSKSRCQICHRVAESCPSDETKSFYVVSKLVRLHRQQGKSVPNGMSPSLSRASRPLKVIVFSQFRQTLDFVGNRLLHRFGAGCIAEYFGKYRRKELHKFTYEPECFCLLLTRDGAEGLDLSFVTNLIFLDEIFDKSLRDQAVARAWRMGAQGCVKVETLIAKNSVEETMGELETSRNEVVVDSKRLGDKERTKSLLLSLKLNTDYHSFANAATSETARGAAPSVAKRQWQHISSSSEELKRATCGQKRVKFRLD